MDEKNKTEAKQPVKAVKQNVPQVPDKKRPTMKEAIIWSEIISPPLAKRKRSRPYTAAR